MTSRLLAIIAAALLGLILLSRSQRVAESRAASADSVVAAGPVEPARPTVVPRLTVPAFEEGATPSIDLMARLAIRRRLDRERGRVYLDSLLLQTDSTLVRWPDRPDKTFRVAFFPDTTLPGWTPSLIDGARAGMDAWRNNEVGLVLRETRDTLEADIRVEWAVMLADSAQLGITETAWEGSGVTNRVRIVLAIRTNPDSQLVPAAIARRVAAHEFGHALGLPHSAQNTDLMFPSSPVASPSRRDQATLLLLYAVPSGPLKDP